VIGCLSKWIVILGLHGNHSMHSLKYHYVFKYTQPCASGTTSTQGTPVLTDVLKHVT